MNWARTVPDPVVRAADEVELVELAPKMLRERMAGGQIYPPGQAEEALAGWFRFGSVSALRELALLWLAVTLARRPCTRRLAGGAFDGKYWLREEKANESYG